MKKGFVYIISNKYRTTLYIGVTGNLERRILEHKSGLGGVFAASYLLKDLLYYESIYGMMNAIDREKQLKRWRRAWKWSLIIQDNRELLDLAKDWYTKDEIVDYRENKLAELKEGLDSKSD
jgi:putative endonuclease